MTNNSFLSILFMILPTFLFGQKVDDYLELIQTKGEDPIYFVQKKLETYDLIMFDDGLHTAYEPFQFYIDLIKDSNTELDFIFLEALGIDTQPDIDAYLNNDQKDKKLLIKVFQNDYSGFGWRNETYLELMSTVWDYNNVQTDEEKKIKVINTSQPVYWEGINTRQDYDIFLQSLTARDYFMYRIIVDKMDDFKSGKKGIYLANTRHVYKNIKKSDGNLFWNTGTFFYNWHPEKTYSVRIHNVMLNIEKVIKEGKSVTAQGLDDVKYSWISPDNGIWDEAFKLNGNKPVAFSMHNNPFGNTKYIGNHMLNIREGQTMFDAYDALIFLAPLEQLHFSAKMDYFYTDNFKEELIRRIRIIYGEDIDEFLINNNASSIDAYIEKVTKYQPKVKNPLLDN